MKQHISIYLIFKLSLFYFNQKFKFVFNDHSELHIVLWRRRQRKNTRGVFLLKLCEVINLLNKHQKHKRSSKEMIFKSEYITFFLLNRFLTKYAYCHEYHTHIVFIIIYFDFLYRSLFLGK